MVKVTSDDYQLTAWQHMPTTIAPQDAIRNICITWMPPKAYTFPKIPPTTSCTQQNDHNGPKSPYENHPSYNLTVVHTRPKWTLYKEVTLHCAGRLGVSKEY